MTTPPVPRSLQLLRWRIAQLQAGDLGSIVHMEGQPVAVGSISGKVAGQRVVTQLVCAEAKPALAKAMPCYGLGCGVMLTRTIVQHGERRSFGQWTFAMNPPFTRSWPS